MKRDKRLSRISGILMLLLLGCSAGNSNLLAQSLKIEVRDEKDAPLAAASVRIIHMADSASWSSYTNNAGVAGFEQVRNGLYSVVISHVSYQAIERSVVTGTGKNRFEFRMTEKVSTLGAVKVTAAKPLIRQEEDKTIIDPEPLANTSTNTLEVLESTPGLFVDQEGGIFLNSATPAVVYINGRELKLSNQDIQTILRSLPPGSVLKIEVIRTPSTKYDAASSGGIINIVLKKGVKIGRFGTVTCGFNQGFYGNQFAGITLNSSDEKNTIYLNINLNNNVRREDLKSHRTLYPDTLLDQMMQSRQADLSGFIGYGISRQHKEKINLSYDGRISLSGYEGNTSNQNTITALENTRIFESDNMITNNNTPFNLQQDLGMIWKPDTTDLEWNTKFGYSYQHYKGIQDYRNNYLFPLTAAQAGTGDNLTNRHFITFQSDFTWPLPWKFKIETGFKSSFQQYNSQSDYTRTLNDVTTLDSLRTNAFGYLESINAAYLQASRELFFKFLLKVGVRMEHTYMDGHQRVPMDTSFLVNRVDWFPYLYLSRKVFQMGEAEIRGFIIVRRSINRPGYQNLNPAIRYVDQFMVEAGNPALKPQFTDNIEVNISYNDMPIFAVGRNYTRDVFANVVYRDEQQESVAVRTMDNLGKNTETYLRAMAGIPPGKKYFFAVGAQYNLNQYDGIYENEPLQYERGGWRFFTFHSLNIFKETRLTMMGFWMYKGNYNFYELEPFGALNFGLTQTLLKKKLQITFSARDVFRTMHTDFSLHLGSMDATGYRYADNQRFGINIRYSFGIRDKEEKREMPEMEGPN
jgi:iron complex outermembrane recepter protein